MQYQITENQIILNVKKSNLFVRGTMFLFAFLFFLFPLISIILSISLGFGMHIGYFIILFIFGILGFYLLRIALWNTFGKEVIEISNTQINYIADYGWFKDGKKHIDILESKSDPIVFEIRKIGYEEELKGALTITLNEKSIFCVTKMDIPEIEEVIDHLKNHKKLQ
ncbi:hypothetical protein [Brumimicrobium mesophilum]|uniref:hypothetical protein n=1 Tax=Brumimicrobium mesophilum TaxID=392717 RepID=UPI000D140B5C|nr:hypothetical protein [Brumimicrobium mesophilum]